MQYLRTWGHYGDNMMYLEVIVDCYHVEEESILVSDRNINLKVSFTELSNCNEIDDSTSGQMPQKHSAFRGILTIKLSRSPCNDRKYSTQNRPTHGIDTSWIHCITDAG